jgi:aminopeptidase-like protein/spore coat polysaccharide biosynthesis protein SpsF (cytidylyltransferase family)
MARLGVTASMTTKTVAIVQARMGSARFPGKMLAHLGGIPLLEWVLRRLARANTLDQIVLATSDSESDNPLADLAIKLGMLVYRGSESDVLARFIGAATMTNATNVVRICADNPFIDPGEVNRLVNYFAEHQCEYACNHQDRLGSGYADGFGAEIFTVDLLNTIAMLAKEPRHREHATLYLWDHASEYKLEAIAAPVELAFPELHFDVDTPDDLINLKALVHAGVTIDTSAHDIIRIVQENRRLASVDFHGDAIAELDSYLQRLFPLCRSITGNPNRETLRILQELIPLTIYEVPSGTAVYDWTIPDEWNIQDAYIADATGQRIIDFQASNLHVVSYSTPVHSNFTWQALQSHLHCHPTLPEAIPYRTSYYQRDWGFCVTHAQYRGLEQHGGPFEIVIDATLEPGSLTYGELLLPGQSKQKILLSCYICHPSMANDSLSGVLLTAFLARELMARANRRYSYRIVFVPETIGAIAYCANNEKAMKQIDLGLVITTVGGPGKFGYKQSYNPDHAINRLIEEVFNEAEEDFITYPFDIHGSDERQYSSQGFRINVATISRDRYYEYPQYHSSLDNLELVTAKQIQETLILYRLLLNKLEARRIYRNCIPHCEVMLSRHDLYPVTGGAQRPELGGQSELDLILWLLFLCDGKLDIVTIACRLDVSEDVLINIADKLVGKGVLETVCQN